jgi:L-ectoine synthase
MKTISVGDLVGTSRDVSHANYRTSRLLITSDGYSIGLTDITLHPGIDAVYGYDDRTEFAYCISGSATVRQLPDGEPFAVGPGTLWIAEPAERFTFVAHEPTRLICIFDPPLAGHETGVIET